MIEDRPLSEFELDIIVESQRRLQEDKIYMELFRLIEEQCKNLSEDMKYIVMKNYEYGFFNGEMFALVKMEKLRELAQEKK